MGSAGEHRACCRLGDPGAVLKIPRQQLIPAAGRGSHAATKANDALPFLASLLSLWDVLGKTVSGREKLPPRAHAAGCRN